MELSNNILEMKQIIEEWLNSEDYNPESNYTWTFACNDDTISEFCRSEYSERLSFIVSDNNICIYIKDKEKYFKTMKKFEKTKLIEEIKYLKLNELLENKRNQMNLDHKREIAKNYFLDFGLNLVTDNNNLTILENINEFTEFTVTITRNLIELRYTVSNIEDKKMLEGTTRRVKWSNDNMVVLLDNYLDIVDKMTDLVTESRFVYCEEEDGDLNDYFDSDELN